MMAGTIDMQLMRYINLFARTTKVTTRCFVYNNQIFFVVPKVKVSVAIGKGAINVKKLSGILRKKIRVIAMPLADGDESIEKFVEDIVAPIEFNKVDVKNGEIVISAGKHSKAALIGRNRVREKELGGVLGDFFGVSRLRIA